ncbi:hypothetical protein ONE63_010608 [Megalurothrips usitatus]|uniref:Uncharacterized protein n=1 Tax=Megalurothrips usitatus TaxID=439358 RepID=A0AAV7XEF7_9NEOP|nr:hypothetical protein ONE63_010608 [Megalurothrips usitatus]
MALWTRLCLFLAAVIAAAAGDLADVMAGPEACPGPAAPMSPAANASSGRASDCRALVCGPAEASMTTAAVIGVVTAQLVVCLVVVVAFQRHMKPPKQE